MSADPITEPSMLPQQDPIDLLIAFEEASEVPIRPEYFEGMGIVPPQPDDEHNHEAAELYFQLRSAGIRLAGFGNGYRVGPRGGRTTALVIPDFYVRRRRPSELDESYRKAHKGWYSIELLALVGEVTSSNHETDTGPKYRTYAAAGVPVYVLLHRQEGKAYAYSDPVQEEDPAKAHYATKVEVELGHPLPLPEPYPKLDTAFLVEE
ncbi:MULTISPECIES: Uma2 family endonuclease [unclassified Streptomyces]|uniref:Uma2 family endonuclease n=1 Tax=unclassified Streptomyces TaxID=2593676 RepID=UPI001CBB8FDB|nr:MULTISPECIES: Uma2 family endonuclease [unclassified Streptomyces]WPO73702.1 Uma2 family endonuclease [Streptomyces sp. KN37]